MHIIIDFDYTLYDTEAMRLAFIDALSEFSISEEMYRSVEKQVKENGTYELEKHIRGMVSHHDFDPAYDRLEEILEDGDQFLYEDAQWFLREYGHEQITVLTFGSPAWQQYKIDASGIGVLVDNIIITDQSKAELMQQWKDEDNLIIINDRGSEIDAMKQVLPNAQYMWLRREGTPYVDEPSTTADKEITNLHIKL